MAKLSAKKKKEKAAKDFPPRLLSVQETASYMGISSRSIYNSTGRKSKNKFPIKAIRIGGLLKFDIQDIDNYIDMLKEV